MVEMRVNDFFGERLQGSPSRYQLSEDLGAVALRLDHPLDTIELPDDFAEAGFERLRLFFWMRVMNVGHAGRV